MEFQADSSYRCSQDEGRVPPLDLQGITAAGDTAQLVQSLPRTLKALDSVSSSAYTGLGTFHLSAEVGGGSGGAGVQGLPQRDS